MNPTDPIIVCDRVSIAYGRQEVVHDACLEVPRGDVEDVVFVPHAALLLLFQHQHGFSGPPAIDRGGEARRTPADNDNVVHLATVPSLPFRSIYVRKTGRRV